ncbi:hypothetical protein ACFXDH_28425, partial [Streptomyces sp. NPDC059467]
MTSHDDLREIDGDVYVSPRHLASSTAVGDPALAPLTDLGWDLHHDDLGIMWNQVCQGSSGILKLIGKSRFGRAGGSIRAACGSDVGVGSVRR